MEQAPTLPQLLKQAIENRLLQVHTALIGRIERYDSSTQLADIQPVITQAIRSAEDKKQLELPLLVDVPILFPRTGEFFISLPIQVGDYVQVIFNETSIDEFLTESPSAIDSFRRFTLQGAVAIPGVYPQAKALKNAHKSNLGIRCQTFSMTLIVQFIIALKSSQAMQRTFQHVYQEIQPHN